MVSYPPSSERQSNANAKAGQQGNGQGRQEKTPGTPRKDVRVVKEKAVQVPELRDYVCSPSGFLEAHVVYTAADAWSRSSGIVWAKEHSVRYTRLSIWGQEKLLLSSRYDWGTCQRANCA